MGREIRRVPKGWQHPTNREGYYQPLYDMEYEAAARQWFKDLQAFLAEHPDGKIRYETGEEYWFWDWHGNPPDQEYYRPAWTDEERTCYQMYENVTEGTPISPVFETESEMRAWLIEQGYSEKATDTFIKQGYAFSFARIPDQDGNYQTARDIHMFDLITEDKEDNDADQKPHR